MYINLRIYFFKIRIDLNILHQERDNVSLWIYLVF